MSRRPPQKERSAPTPPFLRPIPVGPLSRKRPLPVDLQPEPHEKPAIARFLGIEALRRLRFRGELSPIAKEGWHIEGRLEAEVVQSCVVTLEPVTQVIDQAVRRDYLPEQSFTLSDAIDIAPDAEDDPDSFGSTIDPGLLALESLSLALDPYPRAPDVPAAEFEATPPGAQPLAASELKPFAKLAVLKEKLGRED